MRVQGTVEKLRFRNEETGWTVLVLETEDGALPCVGRFPPLREGERWEIEGTLGYHPKYGEQLQVERAVQQTPKTEDQLLRYLSSGLIPFIGKKTAEKLLALFGTEVLQVIAEDEQALLQVRGIGKRRAKAIRQAVIDQQKDREMAIFLQDLDIGPKLAAEIYRVYGEDTRAVVGSNPYQLIDTVPGVGFRTADRLALRQGLPAHSEARTKAAIFYLLQESALSRGHCFLTREELERGLERLLDGSAEALEEALLSLELEAKVRRAAEGQRYYLWTLYQLEDEAARILADMVLRPKAAALSWNPEALDHLMGFPLAEAQKEAIAASAEHLIVVITGGPGTGKTTILRAILAIFDENGLATLLAAPTGRAAKRMEESTGREASTLHRLIGYRGTTAEGLDLSPEHDEESPLTCDALVVDEASMMDLSLLGNLLKSLPEACRLVLVGDVDQLPSVGPGNVLRDLIRSQVVPTLALDTIYRQQGASAIVTNAHRINHGVEPVINRPDRDFFFLPADTAENAAEIVEDLVLRRLPDHYGFHPTREIQVLSAMKKGPCGVENLNRLLQQALNAPRPGQAELRVDPEVFRAGDKIMQTKNDYELEWVTPEGVEGKGIYNGDFGSIVEVDEEAECLRVDFEGRLAEYTAERFAALSHAYAITIHKSQGSEFPCVVVPIVPGPPLLLTRNILYTAITRARKLVVLVGQYEVLRQMIRNNQIQKRNSALDERLVEQVEKQRALYGEPS